MIRLLDYLILACNFYIFTYGFRSITGGISPEKCLPILALWVMLDALIRIGKSVRDITAEEPSNAAD